MAIDPISLEVYWNRLITIMDETDRTLVRTAFSTIVAEGRDFAVILLDAGGTSLAQSVLSSTGFTLMLPTTVRAMLERHPPETLREGDVLITNNPWIGTGHLPDVCVVRPVFHRGKLVAHIACAAHISDIGGNISYFDARDLYEEGLHLPPCKLYEAGKPNETLFEIIKANVRVPDPVVGDLRAIVAAEHVGAERLREFLDDYGLTDIGEISGLLQSLSEQAMRRAIRAIPDGTYAHTVTIDGYRQPVTLAVKVTVAGESMEVDYSGSSPETRDGAINNTLNGTRAGTFVSLKCALAPEIPNNEALFRPISVVAPEGSILNSRFPAPVKGRSVVSVRTHEALYGALAQVIPDKVQAGTGTFWGIIVNGRHTDGSPFNAHIILSGGIGASGRKNGLPTTSFPVNSVVTPSEMFENHVPVLIDAKQLTPGSAGTGRFSGGLGQRLTLLSQSETPITVTLRPVNLKYPPPGLLGGSPGALGAVLLNREPCRQSVVTMQYGDELICDVPGGGGFGPGPGGGTAPAPGSHSTTYKES